MKYSRIIEAVVSTPWAIQVEKLDAIVAFLEFAAAGGKYSEIEAADRVGARRSPSARSTDSGSIAVIPVYGIISQRTELMSNISGPGGTSTESIAASLRAAIADSSVKSILLEVDSPGGTVYGVAELATQIYQARGQKPITAAVNSLAASAAYWIASAADEVTISPGGEVGSIGVYMTHKNFSEALKKDGVDVSLISAGDFKTEGNPYEPLSKEARAFLQSRVDDYYKLFVDAVARNRGVSVATVKSSFGQGRVFGAQQALKVGMVDRIATFDQTLNQALSGGSGRTMASWERKCERELLELGLTPDEASEHTPYGREQLHRKKMIARERERRELELL